MALESNEYRRPALTVLDKAAIGFGGSMVAAAIVWRLFYPAPALTLKASDPPTPPPCYSIGTWLAPGCGARAEPESKARPDQDLAFRSLD